jgi:ankyrin repeat protein
MQPDKLNEKDGLGLLHRMIIWHSIDSVKFLLNPPPNSKTPKANPNLVCNSERHWTPLAYAVQNPITFETGVAELLTVGADVNFKDEEGFSIIHHTVLNGNYKFLQRILIAGADVNA